MSKKQPKENKPKLANRSENRKSTIYSGRTIGEQREQLETASERIALHEKTKRQKIRRIVLASIFIVFIFAFCVWVITYLAPLSDDGENGNSSTSTTIIVPYTPTIEVIDEDATATGGHLTSRMKEYIGQAEADLRELGYTPTKAVIPTGAIREVDFYLDGYTGYIKMTIDRGTGVSAEDADRMIRFLASDRGLNDFEYIDVRIDGKAYWK